MSFKLSRIYIFKVTKKGLQKQNFYKPWEWETFILDKTPVHSWTERKTPVKILVNRLSKFIFP